MEYNEDNDKKIIGKLKKKRRFFQHLIIYIIIIILIVVMSLTFWKGQLWLIFVILGWGIGVASHGVSVFLDKQWEKSKIDEYVEKHKNKKNSCAEKVEEGVDDEGNNT